MKENFKNYIVRGTEVFIYLFLLDLIIELFMIGGNGKLTTLFGLHVESFFTPNAQELILYLDEYSLICYLIFLYLWTKAYKWWQQRQNLSVA